MVSIYRSSCDVSYGEFARPLLHPLAFPVFVMSILNEKYRLSKIEIAQHRFDFALRYRTCRSRFSVDVRTLSILVIVRYSSLPYGSRNVDTVASCFQPTHLETEQLGRRWCSTSSTPAIPRPPRHVSAPLTSSDPGRYVCWMACSQGYVYGRWKLGATR